VYVYLLFSVDAILALKIFVLFWKRKFCTKWWLITDR